MYFIAYFRSTINARCLTTSLLTVLNRLEIKHLGEAATCWHYLYTGAAASCTLTRQPYLPWAPLLSSAEQGVLRNGVETRSVLALQSPPHPLMVLSVCNSPSYWISSGRRARRDVFHSQLLSRDPGQPTGTFLLTGSPPQHTHTLLSLQYTFPYLEKQQKQRQQ